MKVLPGFTISVSFFSTCAFFILSKLWNCFVNISKTESGFNSIEVDFGVFVMSNVTQKGCTEDNDIGRFCIMYSPIS